MLVILSVLALLKASLALLHLIGLVFTVGRAIHAFGMMQPQHPNTLHFIGNLSTGLVLLVGAVSCFHTRSSEA